MFITASKDNTAKLFDIDTLELLKTYKTERPVNSAAISPNYEHVNNPNHLKCNKYSIHLNPVCNKGIICAYRFCLEVVKKPWRSQRLTPDKANSKRDSSILFSKKSSPVSRGTSVQLTAYSFTPEEHSTPVERRMVFFACIILISPTLNINRTISCKFIVG